MANVKISQLPPASAALGTQEFEVNESGISKKVTGAQVSTYVRGQVTLGDLGVTATSSELNVLDGITSSTAELNILDGVTATATELNYVDGVTSSIQTQLDAKAANTTQDQAAWEAGTGTTESLVSPAKVKAAIDALVPGGIGVGQTWQNVTASRTTGTAYQNTTGKPIMIAITRDSIGAESLEISTNGVSWSTILSTGAQGSDTARFQLIIPDQLYYRYNGGAAGTVDWWELR